MGNDNLVFIRVKFQHLIQLESISIVDSKVLSLVVKFDGQKLSGLANLEHRNCVWGFQLARIDLS